MASKPIKFLFITAATLILLYSLYLMYGLYWLSRPPADVTYIDLQLAVCKSIAPSAASKNDIDLDVLQVRAYDEDIAPLVGGKLEEFKKTRPEPIPVTINNGAVYFDDFLVPKDKLRYLVSLCGLIYNSHK